MINFIDDNILNYSISKSEKESKLLNDLYRETYLKVLNPRMISGHYQGRILSLISKIISPKKILEIGTYTGYSAICLCEGMDKDGILHTIDNNKELVEIQNKYFKKANLTNKIVQHSGDAKNIIPSIDEEFDIVFIDADKESYPEYYDLIINKVRSGGIIIADNILWSGKILEKVEKDDQATKSIIEFNNKIIEDDRVKNIILPIRDGLNIVRKN
jgi:caffeoyl-CoA O-methyltransferase|tara:strand:+ start:464 stop:1108 length:645 start_codon:yes stop_codon:yes gene_type:complete